MKTRKPRSDSSDRAITAMQAVRQDPPSVPAQMHLSEAALLYWPAVVAGRAREDWNPIDLVLAARLALTQADISSETDTLAQEGFVIEGRANPRATVVEALVKRELALLRSLRMTGAATGERKEALLNNRDLERRATRVYDDFDDLIAR